MSTVPNSSRAVTYAWISYLASKEADEIAYTLPWDRAPGDDAREADLREAADEAHALAVKHAGGDLDWPAAIRALSAPLADDPTSTDARGQLALPF